jgi:hypothetical protein
MSHIHWVNRGTDTGIPKDKDEVNRREVCECDGDSCLLLIDKARAKDKAYICESCLL